jgi:hypothetical protein
MGAEALSPFPPPPAQSVTREAWRSPGASVPRLLLEGSEGVLLGAARQWASPKRSEGSQVMHPALTRPAGRRWGRSENLD